MCSNAEEPTTDDGQPPLGPAAAGQANWSPSRRPRRRRRFAAGPGMPCAASAAETLRVRVVARIYPISARNLALLPLPICVTPEKQKHRVFPLFHAVFPRSMPSRW